jgi:surfeit locus 1 family protein
MTFSLTGFNLRFTPRWQMSLLAVFAILLFTRLGYWQLQRAAEKKLMLSAHHEFASQDPISWQPDRKLPAQYQPIVVKGHFLPKVLLLDNQHYQHQFGYHVISPLMLVNGHVILVDRGWLAGDVTRRELPEVDVPSGFIDVMGQVYYPSDKNWSLGQLIEKEQLNLAVIELIDTQLVSQFLHKSVYPFIIRLGKYEAGGYVREWAIVSMPPERHDAYALQWFAMALVILILYISLNLKKKHEDCST